MIESVAQQHRPAPFYAYEVLKVTRPNLCLDVGAAAGYMARLMRVNAPECRVIAFEPFEGNMPFLRERAEKEGSIEIVQAAVSDTAGIARFHVGSVVAADGYKGMTGYSSVGRLLGDRATPAKGAIYEVPTVRLDDLVDERVGFMKVDVQGAELEVLEGAKNLVDGPGVDLMFVEFDGDARVLHWLFDRGYRLFDSLYYVTNNDGSFAKTFMHDPEAKTLSTGAQSFSGYLGADIPRDIDGYSAWLKSAGGLGGYAWTDIFAVHNRCADTVVPLI